MKKLFFILISIMMLISSINAQEVCIYEKNLSNRQDVAGTATLVDESGRGPVKVVVIRKLGNNYPGFYVYNTRKEAWCLMDEEINADPIIVIFYGERFYLQYQPHQKKLPAYFKELFPFSEPPVVIQEKVKLKNYF